MKGTLKYLLMGLIMTSVSVFNITIGHTFWGWFGTIFFGFATALFLLKLIFPNAKWLAGIKTSNPTDNRKFEEIYNDNGIFEYLENSFKINSEDGWREIQWTEIETIFGYKVDRFSFDTICIDVFCDNDKGFRITEETAGWFQFLKHLKETFQQIDKKWEFEIATPAFETKLTLIYDRENRTLDEATKKHYKDGQEQNGSR